VPRGIVWELEYRAGSRTWTRAWISHEISDAELIADLAAAGLAFGRWLTGDHVWLTARITSAATTSHDHEASLEN
jgi:hypothetical protein